MCDLFNLRGRNLTNIAREGVLKGGPQMGYAKFSLAGYAKIFGKKSWRERVCIPHLSTQIDLRTPSNVLAVVRSVLSLEAEKMSTHHFAYPRLPPSSSVCRSFRIFSSCEVSRQELKLTLCVLWP